MIETTCVNVKHLPNTSGKLCDNRRINEDTSCQKCKEQTNVYCLKYYWNILDSMRSI